MKLHFSIQELIEIQKSMQNTQYPTTRQAFEYRAKKENWLFNEVKSNGRNGSRREYMVPSDLALSIHNYQFSQSIKALPELTVAHPANSLVVASNVTPSQLADWQRQCAESRLIIVREVQQRVRNGVKKTKAIETLVSQASEGTLPEQIQQVVSLANAKAGTDRTVSRRSVFEWVQLAEDAEHKKISAVAVLAPKPRMVKIPEWAALLLKLYGQPQKPNLTTVLEIMPKHLPEGIPCPTYAQAYRFITEKMGNVEREKGRMGSRELKNIQPFKRRDTSTLMPTDCYTADGHCFDAEVAHPRHGKPFRPEITSIIDVATRMIVGYSIDLAESGWAVLDAIRMSACNNGIPALFYVDNGSGYTNALLKAEGRGLMSRLGCEITHSLPYNSQAKGIIERSHQTLWVKAAKQLPTYIGKDMDDQARQKVFKLTRNEIKLYGQSNALISWSDFLQFAAEVVQQYNNKPHSVLPKFADPQTMKRRHYSPAEAWEIGLKHPDSEIVLVAADEADDLFRPYETRQVRRGEIDLFGNKYFSRELEQYHGETVVVGYDIHDPEKIHVRDPEGRLICKAFWNANKTHYFAKSVIEQAREKRAAGRLRRVAAKQSEILEELSPAALIDHIQQQTLPVTGFRNRTETLAELESLEPAAEVVHFKPKAARLPVEDVTPEVIPFDRDKVNADRWMSIQRHLTADVNSVSEEDFIFWKQFQQSKRFKSLLESNEELSRCFDAAAEVKRG